MDNSDPLDKSPIRKVIFSQDEEKHPFKPLPTIDVEDLHGRTFLCPPEEDGTCHCAKIIKVHEDNLRDMQQHPEMIKLCLQVNDAEYDELVA